MTGPNTKVTELANELRRELDEALLEAERLGRRNEELLQQIHDAEERATIAETRAQTAEETRATLESLATEQYKGVVGWLFEEPSRKAAQLTKYWAVVSIMVGVVATLISIWYSTRLSSAAGIQLLRMQGELPSRISERLSDRIGATEQKLAAELSKTEQRVTNVVQISAMTSASAPPNLRDVPELSRGTTIQRSIPVGQDFYYRVSVPPAVRQVRVNATILSGDANLYFRYGSLPTPNAASSLICRSENGGLIAETCLSVEYPIAGDWFVRVRGVASDYSTFRLETTF